MGLLLARRTLALTSSRYQDCLKHLRLSQRGLAEVLGCSYRLTHEWSLGTASVPQPLAVWLESCVVLRTAKPKAKLLRPPREWRRQRPILISYHGQRLPLQRACEAAGITRTSVYYHARREGASLQATFNRLVNKS